MIAKKFFHYEQIRESINILIDKFNEIQMK